MATKKTQNEFPEKVRVNYLSKDFISIKNELLNLIKYYYPNTYRDFKDGSSGMMFVDLVSAVGDILSFYTDYQFNESFIGNATERKNIISMARFLGYSPKPSRPASTVLDVFQIIPSTINDDGDYIPDENYYLKIKENMVVSSRSGVKFRTISPVDFSINTTDDPTEISVFNRNESGEIQTFLLKKQVIASAGEILTETFQVNSEEDFLRINLIRDDVISIIKVTDSDGYNWYEVDNLGQDVVNTNTKNIETNEKSLFRFKNSVPFILGSLRTDRKFVTGMTEDNTTFLEFGSGGNTNIQDKIISNIKNVNLNRGVNIIPIDPTNFVDGPSFGIRPLNGTSLSIEYVAGGGIESNVGSNELTKISSIEFDQDISFLPSNEQTLFNKLRGSVKVSNPEGATGGKGPESNEEIRQNSLSFFNSQNRVVTSEDYAVRAVSMPRQYGSIAKAFASADDFIRESSNTSYSDEEKSFSVNLYVLSYNSNKKLTSPNDAIIQNLKEYLRRYRILTDEILIKVGNIINIGVNFEVIAFSGENKQSVLANCISVVKDFFDIDRWNFNQSININSLMLSIGNVEGVQSVSKVEIVNKNIENGDYSEKRYDINGATKNGIVFPSVNPSIFELKYPSKDIIGKCL